MKIFRLAIALAISLLPAQMIWAGNDSNQNIVGQWTDNPVVASHRVGRNILSFGEGPGHAWTIKLVGPGFFYFTGLKNLTFNHGKVRFESGVQATGLSIYEGVLSADGKRIVGRLTNGAKGYDMTLFRMTPDPYRSMATKQLGAAIVRGDAKAMVEMGYRDYYADGARFNLNEADQLFRKAAGLGVPNELCMNWYFWIGFKQDLGFAYQCFRLLKAHAWVAYMRFEGLGTPQNKVAALEGLGTAIQAMKDEKSDETLVDLTEMTEPEKRVGLTYRPMDAELLNDLLDRMKVGTPGDYASPTLKPMFPGCFMADNGTFGSGCTNDESSVYEERLAVFIRGYYSDRPLDQKLIYDDYEKKFDAFRWGSAESSGFMSEGGTMQGGVVSGAAFDLLMAHTKEVDDILGKKLSFKAPLPTFVEADSELNRAYKGLMLEADKMTKEMPDLSERNPDYSPKVFRNSELAWIAYRDAALKLIEMAYKGDPAMKSVAMQFKIDATLQQTRRISGYLSSN